ncbi:L-sorbosone dehydrogenase-like [Paramacrobiotus metropolitanus]|uniref:L-sorbosone dehydrogenase-like n=1 Tax=Paramacrobiotus metropolitanus TaxID=2943436 RepID=UPI002446016B|nr:L-sorbosone dehydrogenase-like [Paramacrobiotus metropolitanus]
MFSRRWLSVSVVFATISLIIAQGRQTPCLTGRDAISGDWRTDAPGVCRHITVADLPAPFSTNSVDNGPRLVRRPQNAWPKVPQGFQVQEYVTGLNNNRLLRTAPNGDVFVAESQPGQIRVIRYNDGAVRPEVIKIFATGLEQPFGIAFYPPGNDPQWMYVANTGSVVRFPYRNGDLQARAAPQMIVPDIPSGGRLRGGGHWTRDIVFSQDGTKMYVSVGSHSNVFENPREDETKRANILEYNPDGTGFRIYASGIRNPVGIAISPTTGELWTSVNERDELGDLLPPDYITRVQNNGFYGWPWYYIGPHQDPRHAGKHPELQNSVIVPDVLLQSHSASLQLTFYNGTMFPKEFVGDIFAAEHGSWNRAHRTGYKVIRVPVRGGQPTGEYEDFMTGMVTSDANVWGRPVGVTVARDGALLVSDDGSGTIWRVSYTQ